MSSNYHAVQNKGFPFTGIEEIARKWRKMFSHYDPRRASQILSLNYDERFLYIDYLFSSYRLRLEDGYLEKKLDTPRGKPQSFDFSDEAKDKWDPYWTEDLFFNESIVIYHYLYYVKDAPVNSGVFVASNTLEAAGLRANAKDPLLDPFAKRFEGKLELFIKACENAGGIRIDKGDACYEFHPFPQIPIQILFWDADEDFGAQVQALVDKRITDFVHYETTGCMICDIFERIEKYAAF